MIYLANIIRFNCLAVTDKDFYNTTLQSFETVVRTESVVNRDPLSEVSHLSVKKQPESFLEATEIGFPRNRIGSVKFIFFISEGLLRDLETRLCFR